MRRILLFPILLGVFFTLGAAPAVSSAATCGTISTAGGMQKKGNGAGAQLYFTPWLSCTGTEALELKRFPSGYTYPQGFYDATACAENGSCGWIPGNLANCAGASCVGCTTQSDSSVQNGSPGTYVYQATSICYQPIWWYGGYTRQLAGLFYYRIKNATNHTWGPYHIVQTALYYITN